MAKHWLKTRFGLLLGVALGAMPAFAWGQSLVRLAPLSYRLTGETEFTAQYRGADGEEESSTQVVNNLDTYARSGGYIWKPWFSRLEVNGNASVLQASSYSSEADTDSTSLTLGGGGSIGFFPTSWFPSNLTLNHSVSFLDSQGRDQRSERTVFSATQAYNSRAPEIPDAYVSYNYVTSDTGDNHQKAQRFNLNLQHDVAEHDLDGDFTWSKTEGGQLEEETSYVLQGDHDYVSPRGAVYSDFVSYVKLENKGGETDIRQYSNSYSFRLPDETTLRVSSRISSSDQATQSSEEEFFTFALFGSAQKRFSDRWSLAASSGYQRFESNDQLDETYSLGANSNFTLSGLRWREWDGAVNATADARALASEDSTGVGYGFSFGHGWRRALPAGEPGVDASLAFNQDLNSRLRSIESDDGDGRLLLSQSLTYSRNDAVGGRLVGQLSDSRAFNGGEREQQRLQVVLDKDFIQAGRDSLTGGWTGYLTRTVDDEDEVLAGGAAGVLRFNRQNLLFVPRLRYSASLTMNIDQQFSGEDAEEGERSVYRLDQGVFWVFGRLSFEAEMFYQMESEAGSESRDQYGASVTITRRWDSL